MMTNGTTGSTGSPGETGTTDPAGATSSKRDRGIGVPSYKETLNLPNTRFPMKANLPHEEPKRLARWLARDYYGQMRKARAGRPVFILHDGPPYANGDIHVGHALGSILKDIVNKSQLLSGMDTPYVPGWDCHGLPIEHQVERRQGLSSKSEPIAFRAACRAYAVTQMERQREDFKRLGVLADWENPYWTAQPGYEADIIRALARIADQGYLERRDKPVHWCLDCQSSLAEAEVEYHPKESHSIDVGFPVPVVDYAMWADAFGIPAAHWPTQTAVLIWTTTPWTLPANEAVAVSEETLYVLLEDVQRPLMGMVCAEPLVPSVLARIGLSLDQVQIRGRAMGSALLGLQVTHPFLPKKVPVVVGPHVTLDTGTGVVHIAPAHGEEDYQVALQARLPIQHAVGPDGRFAPQAPLVGGMMLEEAALHLLTVLADLGMLFSTHRITHNYLHCWRHKTPVIARSTPQWFIRVADLREQALRAIEQVEWIPEAGANRIRAMVAHAPDWCISRQRHWCVPIPVFLHRQTGACHPRTGEIMRQVADRVEQVGLEAWFDPAWHQELLGSDAPDYIAGTDGLDVWFDSGVSHWAVLSKRSELGYPADMYFEGSDQHRGWFQSSLMTAMALGLPPPYRQVLTHGFVVDAQGRKMAKSIGNVIAPQTLVSQWGADVLRWWAAATDYRMEVHISEEIVERMVDAYRRIRNTMRFLLSNLHDFDPGRDQVPVAEQLALDQYIVHAAYRLQSELRTHYAQYEFHAVCQKIHQFCGQALGGFYLDIIKDRQYTAASASRVRRSAQTALYTIAEMMVRWIAPILSFTADEIWEYLPGTRDSEAVFWSHWWEPDPAYTRSDGAAALFAWDLLRQLKEGVNQILEKMRQSGAIGSGLAAVVQIYADPAACAWLQPCGEELRFLLITSAVVLHPVADAAGVPPEAERVLPGVWIHAVPSTDPKCVRCWHHRPDVGTHPEHPTICIRCVDNLTSAEGESRVFA